MPDKPLSEWTDEALAKEAARLAALRTEVRLQQNAVADEQSIRAAMSGMSEETQGRFRLRLAGSSTSVGGPNDGGKE